MAEGFPLSILPVNFIPLDRSKSSTQGLNASISKEAPSPGNENKDNEIPFDSTLNLENKNLRSASIEHSLPFDFPDKVPKQKNDLFTSSEKGKMELNIDGKSILSFKVNDNETNPKVKIDSPLLRDYAKTAILDPLKNSFQNTPTTGQALVIIAGVATGSALGLSVPVKMPDVTVGGKTIETSIKTNLRKDTSANFTYGNINLSVSTERSVSINYRVSLF